MKSKIHSLSVITALLILSLLLISTTGAAQSVDDKFYWNGQTAMFDTGINPDTTYGLYNTNGDDTLFESELRSNSSGILEINTSRYPSSKFRVESRSSDYNFTYEVATQDLDIDTNTTSAISGSRIETEMKSNRGVFNVTVNSEEPDNDEIMKSIELPSSRIVEQDDNITLYNVTSSENITINTSYLPKDRITYEYNITDTNATENITFMTTDEPRGEVKFNESVYSGYTGGEFDMQFDVGPDVEEFRIQIGDDVYIQNVTLKQEDNDGKANITFRSYVAGNGSKPVVAGENTKIVKQEPDTSISGEILAPKSYNMRAYVDNITTDSSRIVLNEVGSGEIDFRQLTGDKITVREDDIMNSTETSTISTSDYVVVDIELGGVQSFINDSINADDLSEDSDFGEKHNVYVEIEESDYSSPNAGKRKFNLSLAQRLITDNQNDTIYIVAKASKFPNLERDEYPDSDDDIDTINSFDARFVIGEESKLNPSEDDDIITETDEPIEIVESTVIPRARQVDRDEEYIIDKGEDIVLETSIMNNRNISFILDGKLSTEFNEGVSDDGYINYTLNSSSLSVGDTFGLEIVNTNEEYDMIVGDDDIIENITVPNNTRVGDSTDLTVRINKKYRDNDDLEFEWEIEGEDKEGQNITYNFDNTGEKDISLTVRNDSTILYDTREDTIQVNNSQYGGDLSVEYDEIIFSQTNTTFDSKTGYTGTLSYEWTFNDEIIGTNDTLKYMFKESGEKEITLRATVDDQSSTEQVELYAYDGFGESERIYNHFN